MNKCTNCGRPNSTKKVISHGKILTGCEACLPTLLQQGDSAKFNREWDKRQYRKDLVQPTDPRSFIKAFPDLAREQYSDETFRKYS